MHDSTHVLYILPKPGFSYVKLLLWKYIQRSLYQCQLEQLERLRSEDTPRRLMITRTIESYWIPSQKMTKSKLQILKIRQNFTRHTFWSCLIRCANMKWIRWVLLKIQSGHDSVHRRTDGRTDRRTDGQTDRRTRWYQYTPLSTSLKRGV